MRPAASSQASSGAVAGSSPVRRSGRGGFPVRAAVVMFWLAMHVGAADASKGPVPEVPMPDVGLSALRVLGALALVMALFLGGAWLYRNWQRAVARRGPGAHLQVLEARSLGSRNALYVVGYDGERFLLGSSPSGLTLLTNLPPAVQAESVAHEPPATFLANLRAVMERR